MYGIEGRYRKGQPQTFGRRELADLLKNAGFSSIEFLAPFPDYKLPVSIVTERGFSCDVFDAGAFAWQNVRRDPQLPRTLAFSPELVWPYVSDNGLALDLANSFLVIASPTEGERLLPTGALAWHFATGRRKVFCKIAEFVQREANQVEVRYKRLDPTAPNPVVGNLLKHYLPERAEYKPGKLFSYEIMRVVARDGWRVKEVSELLRKWLAFIVKLACDQGHFIDLASPFSKLPGSFFDYIPQNIVISDDGNFHVIDTEWAATEKIEVGYLVFRSLSEVVKNLTRPGRGAEDVNVSDYGFISSVMNHMGWSIFGDIIHRYVKLESRIQAEVSGRLLDK